jgi:hypothetical protein
LTNAGYDSMAPYLSGMMPDEDCPLDIVGPLKRPNEYFPDSTF